MEYFNIVIHIQQSSNSIKKLVDHKSISIYKFIIFFLHSDIVTIMSHKLFYLKKLTGNKGNNILSVINIYIGKTYIYGLFPQILINLLLRVDSGLFFFKGVIFILLYVYLHLFEESKKI